MFSPHRLFLSPGGMIVAELFDLLGKLDSLHLCIVLVAVLLFAALIATRTIGLLRHLVTCLTALFRGWPYPHCWEDEDEEDDDD